MRREVSEAARTRRPTGWDDAHAIMVAGTQLVPDLLGALYWPGERVLVVADLHLEKGSSLASRGTLLPPYDTAETLERLAWVVAVYDPRLVIALGDSFHDRGGATRLGPPHRAALAAMQHGRDWVWIAGNHDPAPCALPGISAPAFRHGPLTFRHEPGTEPEAGEIAGHLHPAARVSRRGRSLTRRCFVGDGKRLVMPAFGAYAGGLNIRDRAFLAVFGAVSFTAHLIGDRRLFAVPGARCLG